MKPFVINRNSWHYKLNKNFFNDEEYWMKRSWEPKHANFCAYWRATIFRVIGASLFALVIVTFLYIIGGAAYNEPVKTFMALGSVIGIISAIIVVVVAKEKFSKRKAKSEKPESLIVQKLRAHKSKICPTVDFK